MLDVISSRQGNLIDPIATITHMEKVIILRHQAAEIRRVMSRFAHKGLEAFDEPLFLSPTLCYPNPLNPNPTFVLCLSPTP